MGKYKTFLIILFLLIIFLFNVPQNKKIYETNTKEMKYPLHKNITTTVFWVGEEAGPDNNFIPNHQSAWDNNWQEHFGGVDNPDSRTNYFPTEFIPKENPFYFALPYNDFTSEGIRKENSKKVYWYEENFSEKESMLKNKWIKITKNNKTVYAQWEDSGPFQYDDINYVFGESKPKNKFNSNTGLDVSPAVRDYLGLKDIDKVDWQFIDASEVPEGPWKNIITSTNLNWG